MYNIKHYAALLCAGALLLSCSKDNEPDGPNDNPNNSGANRSLGWNREGEDYSKYPKEISFKFSSSGSTTNLPAKVDLTDKLPPVGNQGQYGTCITWSVGYGMRTWLNATSRGLTKQQLADKSNQFSPADLWMSIKAADKGEDCGGANFEPAFDVLVNRGIANLQTAPYSSLQCEASPSSAWTNNAANYKISNYRMIAESDLTVANLKQHLAGGQLISFGAKLGDNFMDWRSGVLSSDTYLEPGMQHAYHAIVLAGYDDSKGANGAFLVYNSWGESWGEKGYIWVDCNFFVRDFAFCAFVATQDNNVNPNGDNEIDPRNLSSGADLAAYHAYDIPFTQQYGYNRQVYFNIYNSGTAPIASSNRWSVVYMYYNAYDANDYGVLAHLYFTNETQRGQIIPVQQQYVAYAINKDVPSGKNISAAVFDQPYEYLNMTYYLPPITGYYYMVVMADAFNTVPEVNEQNNFFFIADANGRPYYIQNGMPYGSSQLRSAKDAAPLHSPAEVEGNRNAYTPEEIRGLIIDRKRSGEINERVEQLRMENGELRMGGGN